MNLEKTYRSMQEDICPDKKLIQQTVHAAEAKRRPRRHWQKPLAVAAALALCLTLAPPVLATQSETVHALLYHLSPAAAQLFQPVERSAVDNGIRMEVVGVSVEGDTAQAYITLQDLEGNRVDETTDLYDSYSMAIPFDSVGHCERLGYDEETKTVTFLVTQQTMDGSPIPGGKMSFSLRCFLSGKETVENLEVPLTLSDYDAEVPTSDSLSSNGGGGMGYEEYGENAPMLLPGAPLTTPAEGIPLTAAGYADGLLHVQAQLLENSKTDNHCFLYLKNSAGEVLQSLASVSFTDYATENRQTYTDFLFDVLPEELSDYTLYGDFYTASTYTEGNWRITFPLKNT